MPAAGAPPRWAQAALQDERRRCRAAGHDHFVLGPESALGRSQLHGASSSTRAATSAATCETIEKTGSHSIGIIP